VKNAGLPLPPSPPPLNPCTLPSFKGGTRVATCGKKCTTDSKTMMCETPELLQFEALQREAYARVCAADKIERQEKLAQQFHTLVGVAADAPQPPRFVCLVMQDMLRKHQVICQPVEADKPTMVRLSLADSATTVAHKTSAELNADYKKLSQQRQEVNEMRRRLHGIEYFQGLVKGTETLHPAPFAVDYMPSRTAKLMLADRGIGCRESGFDAEGYATIELFKTF